jgi:predicted XRE-type DNA-binding protein
MVKITDSSGNVFKDLKMPNAENLKLRSRLMIEIARYIEAHGLTQAEAAKQMGTTQPRINDIVKGRIDKCTIDRLVNMLAAIGVQIVLSVEQAA